MQDNDFERRVARANAKHRLEISGVPIDNIAENGRWGSLGMAAIALHQDQTFLAFVFVLALFLAYVVEQLEGPLNKRAGVLFVTIWTITALIVLFWQIII